jgi:hypothetical protein
MVDTFIVPSPLDWFFVATTWSVSNNKCRFYFNGTQFGADADAEAWNGILTGQREIIGADSNSGVGGTWIGWVAHCAVWSKALTAAQIAYLSKV